MRWENLPEATVRNHNFLLPADPVRAELVHGTGEEDRDKEPVTDSFSVSLRCHACTLYIAIAICLHLPDNRAENYRGKDKLPVQLVCVGEDAHAQEEEDDAVAENREGEDEN